MHQCFTNQITAKKKKDLVYTKAEPTWDKPILLLVFTKKLTKLVAQRCSVKNLFLKCCSIHRKTPVLESILNTVAGLKTYNFILKRLQHRYFPVNIAKFLRTSVLKNICEQLLLNEVVTMF